MNVWCHLPTIISQRRFLKILGLLTLCVALITTLFFNVATHAAPGVNQTISFQGRLLDKNGGPVADGYYNIQFKIYQDGSGTQANNPDGTLEWTETRINNGGNNGVFVKNGYMSVDLGSQTPFGTSVDWNQDTLWLSMNIAGSSTVCTEFGTAPCLADGEMLPMKRLTATPYALNSAKLGGKTADDFIQNGTTQQTGNFNISGTGIAGTIQGNTSVLAPLFDTPTTNGILSIGTTNASEINIGTNLYAQDINIGTATNGIKNVTIGSLASTSSTLIQGGDLGVRVESNGGFAVHNNRSGIDTLLLDTAGNTKVSLVNSSEFTVENELGQGLFSVNNNGIVSTSYEAALQVNGDAFFNRGLTIQGGGSLMYTTPGGASLKTAINIPNYQLNAYDTIFAFGLPASSASTARGMLIADARTGNHQATIGVLSPDEDQIMGFSWNGSNSTGYITNTANKIALQGGGLDLLTVNNNGGVANVGIGNNASSGYALDVTGGANVSSGYSINGVSVLNNNGLNFSGSSTSTVAAASGQTLQLTGDGGVRIGDGQASGQPTLLTVDKASATPTATGDAVLGSMYYDTTLGKLQCYEADGWGACSSSPDNFVTLSPEYTNAVTNGSGVGDMTSDICSDTLNLNDGSSSQPTICGTNETYNFYNWTTTETSAQTKDIYVTYQLPSNFTGFVDGSTSLIGRTNDAAADVSYQVYKNTASGLVACGSSVSVSTGAQSTWQKATATGSADPSNCNFTANDSIVFKISLTSQYTTQATNAYASTLSFAFSDN